MVSKTDKFKFECECGSRSFNLIHRPSSNSKLYFMCENCHGICGITDSYAISWLREDKDYDEED